MQQGTIDGVMSCIPVFVALKYADAAKYLVETNHGLISAITVISKTWFDALPPDLQEIVVKAGQQASNDIYQFSVDDVNNGRDKWKSGRRRNHRAAPSRTRPADEATGHRGRAASTDKNPGEKAMFDLLRLPPIERNNGVAIRARR